MEKIKIDENTPRRCVMRFKEQDSEENALIQIVRSHVTKRGATNFARNLLLLGVRSGKKGL